MAYFVTFCIVTICSCHCCGSSSKGHFFRRKSIWVVIPWVWQRIEPRLKKTWTMTAWRLVCRGRDWSNWWAKIERRMSTIRCSNLEWFLFVRSWLGFSDFCRLRWNSIDWNIETWNLTDFLFPNYTKVRLSPGSILPYFLHLRTNLQTHPKML